MRLPDHALLRFALYAVASVLGGLLVAWVTGIHDLQRPVTAILMGVAAWLAPVRSLPGAAAALLIAVVAFMGVFVLPLYVLLYGSFYPSANLELARHALMMAALFALPVAAGAGLSRYRPR